MAAGTPSLKLPLSLASLWLLTVSVSVLAVLLIAMTVPHWHTARGYFAQLGVWQAWISIAACVGLLMLSKRKYAQSQEQWAQGALLIFVVGGLLTAIVLNYGVLPQWLLQSSSVFKQLQVLGVLALHWVCALCTLRSLLKFRSQA